ncbi:MAG: hypothetical protein Tsb0015_03200 [Simkaniaceae bacterium]
MGRIFSEIKNGTFRLVVSETVCINPALGMQLTLPISPDKKLLLSFQFTNKDLKEDQIKTEVKGEKIEISFYNFLHSLGVSLAMPIRFSVGNTWFSMRMYGVSNNPEVLSLTISIYKEEALDA